MRKLRWKISPEDHERLLQKLADMAKSHENDCPECGGSGLMHISRGTRSCPCCRGTGKRRTFS